MTIPQIVFDKYNTIVDSMISNDFGINCKLIYPGIKTNCDNCILNTMTGNSTNIYRSGGPYPFSSGSICPYCNGEGAKIIESTEVIKLRVYWSKKDWAKVVPAISIPEAASLVIGFLTDLPKLQRCQSIILNSDQDGYNNWTFELAGEPVPHGFKHNRYFAAFLKRTMG